MKTEFGKKIKMFWDKHKVDIIFWGGLVITGTIAGAAFDYCDKKRREAHEKLMSDIQEQHEKNMEAIENEKDSWEKAWEARQHDPANTLPSGGWITESYDMDYDADGPHEMTEFILNDVPVENLGIFGTELLEKLDERRPGHKEIGEVCMIIDLCEKEENKDEQAA